MKKGVRIIFLAIALVAVIIAFAACGDMTKEPGSAPDGEGMDFTIGADTITISRSISEREFSLDGQNWQDSPIFTDLNPNTEYTVYVRYTAKGNWPASLAYTKTVKTLKYKQSVVPNVSYTQADKTVTFAFDTSTGLEYSYDGGTNYVSDKNYTYTDNGDYVIKVRYKETNDKYSSGDFIINIRVSEFYSGFGTEQDPYLIKTLDHFNSMSTKAYYKLIEDISFTDIITQPVEIYNSTFDGNGHKLINPKVKVTEGTSAGVFKYVGEVKNLTIQDAEINFTNNSNVNFYVGIIAGNSQIISNCNVNGVINITNTRTVGEIYIGGLAGRFNGGLSGKDGFLIEKSSAEVKIDCNFSDYTGTLYAGGLIGADYNSGLLSVTKSYAKIIFEHLKTYGGFIGGIAGSMAGNIESCYATGSITTDGKSSESTFLKIGGIVGKLNNGNINNCYAVMNIGSNGMNQNILIGGIAGELASITSKTVSNCFFSGNIYITAEITRICRSDSLTPSAVVNYDVENCYHSDNLSSPVDTTKTTGVSEHVMITVDWQKNILGFGDDIWNFTAGEYPALK